MTECVITVEHIRRNPSSIVSAVKMDSGNFFYGPCSVRKQPKMIGVHDKSANFPCLPFDLATFLLLLVSWTEQVLAVCTLIFYLLAWQNKFRRFIFFVNLGTGNSFFFPRSSRRWCLCWERLFNLFLFHWKPKSKNVSDTHTKTRYFCPKIVLCPYLDAKVTRDNEKSFGRFNHSFSEHFSNFFCGQRKGQQRNFCFWRRLTMWLVSDWNEIFLLWFRVATFSGWHLFNVLNIIQFAYC